MKAAGIEVEVTTVDGKQELHLYPRESRRGKAQWAIYVREDGSGFMFLGSEQVHLPANGQKSSTRGKTLQRVSPDDFSYALQAETRTLDDVSALCENLDELTAYLKSGTGQRFKIVLL